MCLQDMVLEVRDGRIPMSTRHPSIPKWVGNKPRVMVLNRRDMVSNEEGFHMEKRKKGGRGSK